MGLLTAAAIIGGVGAVAKGAYEHWKYEDTKKYNSAEAEKNRAHDLLIKQNQNQWAVEDMKKAGLNPAMMFGSGGVSMSSGSSAASVNAGTGTADAISSISNVINSAASVISATKPKSEPYEIATKILTSASKILNN